MAYYSQQYRLHVISHVINKRKMKKFSTYKVLPERIKAFAVATLIALTGFTAFSQTPVPGNFTNFTYMERTSPVLLAPTLTLTGGASYTDGFIRFGIPSSGGTETLALTSAANPTTAGAISIDGISVYLGQGGGNRVRIGEIDATENGQNGNPLKINITFVRSFPNASFEDGISGWTVYNQLYSRQNELNGMEIPIRPGESDCSFTHGKIRIATNPTGTQFQVSQTTDQNPTDGIYCIRLYNYGIVPSAYGANCREAAYSIFGPTIISNSFNAYNGDIFSVDWKAAAGGDWYDVLGYLLGYGPDKTWGTADDTRTLMFAQRGSFSPWQTSSITIPSDGEYMFEFVSGSYDRTGGTVLGATLYVDNLRLVSGAMVGVDDATMQAIARQVTYYNSTCEPPANQTINIHARNTAGNTGSVSASVNITPVNCPPNVDAISLNPVFIENSLAVSLFSDVVVTNIETGQSVTGLHFTVAGVKDGSSEVLTIDGTQVPVINGSTGSTSGNGIDYSVLLSGETATIILSKPAGISAETLKNLLEQLTYTNISGSPAAAVRTVSLTYVRDNGGIENGGSDESIISINSSVNVKPATNISLFAGNNQTAEAGSTLSDFIVLVTTSDGIPVSGRELSFAIVSAPAETTDHSISASSGSTDSEGKSATRLTLGTKAGLYTITAESAGLTGSPVSFTATAMPAAIDPDVSEVSIDGMEFKAGQHVTVIVSPKDQYGNYAGPGKTVTVLLDGAASDADGPVSVSDNGDGSYTAAVRLSLTSAANVLTVTADGVNLSDSFDLTVTPGDAHEIIVTGMVAHTYGDLQNLSLTVLDQYQNLKTDYTGTVEFSSDDSGAILPSPFTFTLSDGGTKTITGEVRYSRAGTFNLVATDAEFDAVKGSQNDIIVSKRMLQAIAANQTKSYGSSNPELIITYSGFINSEDEEILNTKPLASTTINASTPAGTYTGAITVTGGVDSRYDFTYTAGDFEVVKAILTVTANPVTRVYGEPNPTLSYNITGFVAGETAAVLISEPEIVTAVSTTSDAGTYEGAITIAGGNAENYDFTYIAADYEIIKAALTVTADNKTKVYGSENPELTFTYSGFISDEDSSVLDTEPSVSTMVNAATPAGEYKDAIGFINGFDNNYEFFYTPADFEVTRAMLTVTAVDISRPYGSENPELTLVYSGFVPGEDENVLETVPVASTAINHYADAGSYSGVITVSGGSDNNYEFTYVAGSLEITKALLTITADPKTKVYGSENPGLTFSYTGFADWDNESVMVSVPIAETTVTTSTAAGTYNAAITLSGGEALNYDITYVAAGFEVTRATLTVIPDNKQKVYGTQNPELSCVITGFVLGETSTVIETMPVIYTVADQFSDAGTYTITVSGGVSANYMFNYQTGTLTIIRADQSIVFPDLPSGLRITEEHQLNAVATSGLQVVYELLTPETGSLSGNYITVSREGTLTVRASQPGNHNWNPATAVVRSAATLPTFDNISSLFTPNNDGMNDFWYIPGLYEMGQVHVKVYNRFGKLVYESAAYNNDWDGTWNGKPLPSASYYYIINSPVRGIIKGTVNIVR